MGAKQVCVRHIPCLHCAICSKEGQVFFISFGSTEKCFKILHTGDHTFRFAWKSLVYVFCLKSVLTDFFTLISIV